MNRPERQESTFGRDYVVHHTHVCGGYRLAKESMPTAEISNPSLTWPACGGVVPIGS